jgi:hypothetical protein
VLSVSQGNDDDGHHQHHADDYDDHDDDIEDHADDDHDHDDDDGFLGCWLSQG